MLAFIDADNIMFQLTKHALLNYPIVSLMKLLFDPVAEFEVHLKRVLSKHLVEVHSCEQLSACIRLVD